MTSNFKKFLLLSALTVQSFATVSYAATITNMDDVITASANQLANAPNYRLGVASDLSLAVSLGKPLDNVTTAHAKLDVIVQAANGVSILATLSQITGAINTGVSGLATSAQVSTLTNIIGTPASGTIVSALGTIAAAVTATQEQADVAAALQSAKMIDTNGNLLLATATGLANAVQPLATSTQVSTLTNIIGTPASGTIVSALSSIASAVTAQAQQADVAAALQSAKMIDTSGNLLLATATGLTSAVAPLAKTTDVTAAISSVLIPLKLTNTVDNMMDHVFGGTALGGGSFKFPGNSGDKNYLKSYSSTFSSPPPTGEYQITSGGAVVGLFDPVKGNNANMALLTPAQKLTIFLRAVFCINASDFSSKVITFPSSSGYGVPGADQEDSGSVLTAVFYYVLGQKRDGTGGTNKFGGTSGTFGHIALSSTYAPTTYFSSLSIADAGTNYGSADIARLRALLTDLVPNI